MSEAARIAALKAALELRTASTTAAELIALAREFEVYLIQPSAGARKRENVGQPGRAGPTARA